MNTILLVEDDEILKEMMAERLEMKGFNVIVGMNGLQAVELAQAEQPDLILMDMSLPVLSGWEATTRLKAGDDTRTIPIIALTAHAIAGDREKALKAGCDDYESKPANFPKLLEKIQLLINQINHNKLLGDHHGR